MLITAANKNWALREDTNSVLLMELVNSYAVGYTRTLPGTSVQIPRGDCADLAAWVHASLTLSPFQFLPGGLHRVVININT